MSQQELFPKKIEPNPNEEFLTNQLIKLGDMMGDGLHHEPDGKWIEVEYRRICKLLHPDIYQRIRKEKANNIDSQMADLLANVKSKCCEATLRQSRKGSKIAYCTKCGNRFKAKSKKK